MDEQQKYLEEIQARICRKCIDSDGAGNCIVSNATECIVTRVFPQVLTTVRAVSSISMEFYEAELRKQVCSECVHQSANGTCAMRDDVECALDRYFPLIVQTIEELDQQQGSSHSTVGMK